MLKKKKIIKYIEECINNQKKETMESFFGNGFIFKIQNVDYSHRLKTIYFEVKITFGENFDESFIDLTNIFDTIICLSIKDVMDYIVPDEKIFVIVSYDI